MSEEEVRFLPEAYRFFILNYVVREGARFFRRDLCARCSGPTRCAPTCRRSSTSTSPRCCADDRHASTSASSAAPTSTSSPAPPGCPGPARRCWARPSPSTPAARASTRPSPRRGPGRGWRSSARSATTPRATCCSRCSTARASTPRLGPRVDAPTGRALIGVADDGENSIIVVPGANAVRRPVDARCRRRAVVLVQLEVPTPRRARRAARRAGRRRHHRAQPGAGRGARPRAARRCATWSCPTSTRPSCSAGAAGAARAGARRPSSSRSAARASRAPRRRRHVDIGAFAVDVVDTTAAGDAFCGALCARLAAGDDLDAALRFAMAAGALATTVAGAVPSLPRRARDRGAPQARRLTAAQPSSRSTSITCNGAQRLDDVVEAVGEHAGDHQHAGRGEHPAQVGGQLDQRRGEDVGDDDVERLVDLGRAASCRRAPGRRRRCARALSSVALDRRRGDVDRLHAGRPEQRGDDAEHARAAADVEHDARRRTGPCAAPAASPRSSGGCPARTPRPARCARRARPARRRTSSHAGTMTRSSATHVGVDVGPPGVGDRVVDVDEPPAPPRREALGRRW